MPNIIINMPLYITGITISLVYILNSLKLSTTAAVARWWSTGLVIQ